MTLRKNPAPTNPINYSCISTINHRIHPHFRKKIAPTKEGVVLIPSAFSMTFGVLPSMMATQLLVVPEKTATGRRLWRPPGLVNIKKKLLNMAIYSELCEFSHEKLWFSKSCLYVYQRVSDFHGLQLFQASFCCSDFFTIHWSTISIYYPLVNTQKTMKNHHCE